MFSDIMNRHRVVDPRRSAFSKLASSRSIDDDLLDRSPASESTEERDESSHDSEVVGSILPTTVRRVSLDEFFMHHAQKSNELAQKSKVPEKAIKFYDPSSFSEPKASAHFKWKHPVASHFSGRNISSIYTTFPQLRFEGEIAYVVYDRALLVSYANFNEREQRKKRTKKFAEKDHSAVGIQEALFQKPARVDTLPTTKASKVFERTQFVLVNRANAAA